MTTDTHIEIIPIGDDNKKVYKKAGSSKTIELIIKTQNSEIQNRNGSNTSSVDIKSVKIKNGNTVLTTNTFTKTEYSKEVTQSDAGFTSWSLETITTIHWKAEFNLQVAGKYDILVEYRTSNSNMNEAKPSPSFFEIVDDDTLPLLILNVHNADLKALESKGFELKFSVGAYEDNAWDAGVDRLEWSIEGTGIGNTLYPSQSNKSIPNTTITTNLPHGKLPETRAYTLRATAYDKVGNQANLLKTLTAVDDIPPRVEVVSHPKNHIEISNKIPCAIEFEGISYDSGSGMIGGQARIEFFLDGELVQVTPENSDCTEWMMKATVNSYGVHTLQFRLWDHDGNTHVENWEFDLISAHKPTDLEERISQRAYLADLLKFIRDNLSIENQRATPNRLIKLLGQDFNKLSQFESKYAEKPVLQLRIANEILYEYVTNSADKKEASKQYLYKLYRALLREFDTSYEELRMTIENSTDIQSNIGRRMQIGRFPDEISARIKDLIFPPGLATANLELQIQKYFGISPINNPYPSYAVPLLLRWQQITLEEHWLEQDHTGTNGTNLPVLIDPDLIQEEDIFFISPPKLLPGQPKKPLDILQERRAMLQSEYERLDNLRRQTHPRLSFDAFIEKVVPDFSFKALQKKIKDGIPEQEIAASYNLTLAGLNRLMQLRSMVVDGEISQLNAEERKDVFDILVQAFKQRKWKEWALEEQKWSLSPASFKIADYEKTYNPWRASPVGYQQWQNLLKSRIAQKEALEEAFYKKIAIAEADTLPFLRDKLLASADAWSLSNTYFVDFTCTSAVVTTRVEQACASLQNLVFAIRMGQLPDNHGAQNWRINNVDNFDKSWKWIGTYESWRAAMSVFLFPENYLFPLEKLNPSVNFQTISVKIRAGSVITEEDIKDLFNVAVPNEKNEKEYFVPLARALQLQKSGLYMEALDLYRTSIYNYDERSKIGGLLINEDSTLIPDLTRDSDWCLEINPHRIVLNRKTLNSVNLVSTKTVNYYTRFALINLIGCLTDYGDSEFAKETLSSLSIARSLYLTALEIANSDELKMPEYTTPIVEPPVPNPAIEALRTRIQNQLRKLSEGRNIAGIKRESGISRTSGLLPGFAQPTPYPFKILIERSKQLVSIAQQIEAAYLSAMEKRDDQNYRLFEANKGVGLAFANLNVFQARVSEAQYGEILAQKQVERARYSESEMNNRIARGPNQYERNMLKGYRDILEHKNLIAGLDAFIGATSATAAATDFFKNLASFGINAIAQSTIAVAYGAKGITMGFLNAAEADLQANAILAGHERQKDEWRMQAALAGKEAGTAMQQVLQARAHITVVQEEQKVAELQAKHAQDTVTFLDRLELNAEMYDWMAGVLKGVYAYFLQQATALAKLAQNQLAFERQETSPAYIQGNYWELPNKTSSGSNASSKSVNKDRLGLTGAELLLRDIHQLDQFAFETERRKLNLSQTLSLAQLLPQEFQAFKESGVLQFVTPLSMFDQEFPGHYLRLIKRVKVTVIALVPATRGIRASLYSNGISRVVAKGGTFQELLLRRSPEYVALTAPAGSSGVFELDMQPELMHPFEGSGLETFWEFEMPKAANPFNFQTIVDVLITIDYTAYHDYNYRQQVIEKLPRHTQGQRSFSVRTYFPDEWYKLANPDAVPEDQQYMIRFETHKSDFPANIDITSIQHIVILLVFKAGKETSYPLELSFNGKQSVRVKSNEFGILSTRHNASIWRHELGFDMQPPIGDWVLGLRGSSPSEHQKLDSWLQDGDLEDIIIVIGYQGQMAQWPNT